MYSVECLYRELEGPWTGSGFHGAANHTPETSIFVAFPDEPSHLRVLTPDIPHERALVLRKVMNTFWGKREDNRSKATTVPSGVVSF